MENEIELDKTAELSDFLNKMYRKAVNENEWLRPEGYTPPIKQYKKQQYSPTPINNPKPNIIQSANDKLVTTLNGAYRSIMKPNLPKPMLQLGAPVVKNNSMVPAIKNTGLVKASNELYRKAMSHIQNLDFSKLLQKIHKHLYGLTSEIYDKHIAPITSKGLPRVALTAVGYIAQQAYKNLANKGSGTKMLSGPGLASGLQSKMLGTATEEGLKRLYGKVGEKLFGTDGEGGATTFSRKAGDFASEKLKQGYEYVKEKMNGTKQESSSGGLGTTSKPNGKKIDLKSLYGTAGVMGGGMLGGSLGNSMYQRKMDDYEKGKRKKAPSKFWNVAMPTILGSAIGGYGAYKIPTILKR